MKFLKDNWQPFLLTVAAVLTALYFSSAIFGAIAKAKAKANGTPAT